jgi:iron complex outermembrane receptor protein
VTSATDIGLGRFAFTTPNPAIPGGLLYWRYTSQNQTGQQIARAPKWTLNGGFTYDHQLGANVGGAISFDVTYTSSYQTQIEAQPEARQPGYWMLNGNLTLYGGRDRAWQVALIGRNLTNKIVAISGGAVAFVGTGTGTPAAVKADLYGSVSLPRQVLLQVTLKNTLFK